MNAMLAVVAAAVCSCATIAAAQVNPLIGTWSMQVRTQLTDQMTGAPVVLGVIFLTFNPNGTFTEFFQLQNGQSEFFGRYVFNGSSITAVIESYQPSSFTPPPNFRQVQTTPIQVGAARMVMNGEVWNRQTPPP